jgi:ribosomal protein S20
MALPMKRVAMAKKSIMKAKPMKSAMKTGMKRVMKAMKTSQIAKGKRAKSAVFRGTKTKTSGGLTKDKLTKNKAGKVVSKAASTRAKKNYSRGLGRWTAAVTTARKELGITGFCAVGGKSAAGKALYAKAKSIYSK